MWSKKWTASQQASLSGDKHVHAGFLIQPASVITINFVYVVAVSQHLQCPSLDLMAVSALLS